ncbi:hypothetical protein [Corynebacterium mastitidis]|uniref:hypothetical protein n=1 Tax=Corynebacterium mastitidis TaxID=161890 RepID=UPI0003686194|nr:hypothetical protein [Corynebacterium mastitidis]
MSYGDYVIRRQERLVDDEFERAMLHKSATVALSYNDWLILAACAALVWLLPGNYALAGLIAIVPLSFSRFLGIQWMRRTVPLPRYAVPSKGEFLGMVAAMAIIAVGLYHNLGWPKDPFSFLPLLGGLTGSYYAYRRSGARREADRRALDAEQAED